LYPNEKRAFGTRTMRGVRGYLKGFVGDVPNLVAAQVDVLEPVHIHEGSSLDPLDGIVLQADGR